MSSCAHLPEVLLAVASYQRRREQFAPPRADSTAPDRPPRIHDRPSLAWCASHPVARLVAEMRGADRVVFFDTADHGKGKKKKTSSNDKTALALASASTLPVEAQRVVFAAQQDNAPRWRRYLRRINFADVDMISEEEAGATLNVVDEIGGPSPTTNSGREFPAQAETEAEAEETASRAEAEGPSRSRTDCGVETAGLVSVLVSREYLLSRGAPRHQSGAVQPSPEPHKAGAYVSHTVSLPSLREWLSATCAAGKSSDAIAALPSYLPGGAESDFFLFAPATVTQEWLSLPEAAVFTRSKKGHDEEGSRPADNMRHKAKTAAATYIASRFAASPCDTPADNSTATCPNGDDDDGSYLFRQVFIADADAFQRVLLDASQWWLQRPISWHELPTVCTPRRATRTASGPASVLPALHIKFVEDVFSTPLLTRLAKRWLRSFSVVHDTLARETDAPLPPCLFTNWMMGQWSTGRRVQPGPGSVFNNLLMLFCAVVAVVHAFFSAACRVLLVGRRGRTHHTASVANATSSEVLSETVQASDLSEQHALWQKLGATYAAQLESLDASYTSVTGGELLAMMSGTTTSQDGPQVPAPVMVKLRTLDLCGCRGLHKGAPPFQRADAAVPFPDALRRALQWLPCESPLGRALALATCDGGLQLVNASGSSLDDAALRELGHVCLVLEATQRASLFPSDALNAPPPPAPLRPSLLAMDLSSCDAVANLNPLAFVGSLLQLLAAFSSVNSDGVVHLDGSHCSTVLSELLAAHVDQDRHARAAYHLFCVSASSSSGSVAPVVVVDKTRAATRHALYDVFRSHLYHLDFAYCVPLDDINALGRQRVLHYLNTSHCCLSDAGVKHLSGAPKGGGAGGADHPHSGPPLVVVIAEFCDLLGSLEGLAWLPRLKKLYIRSSSLTDAGLAALVSHRCPVELLELSYCPKVEMLDSLSRLPELRTLILDCTEIKRAGVKGLATCPKLETLSLRCCADFASVGDSRRLFDTHVVRIPTLKHYVYEDLIGDEAYREYE